MKRDDVLGPWSSVLGPHGPWSPWSLVLDLWSLVPFPFVLQTPNSLARDDSSRSSLATSGFKRSQLVTEQRSLNPNEVLYCPAGETEPRANILAVSTEAETQAKKLALPAKVQ